MGRNKINCRVSTEAWQFDGLVSSEKDGLMEYLQKSGKIPEYLEKSREEKEAGGL